MAYKLQFKRANTILALGWKPINEVCASALSLHTVHEARVYTMYIMYILCS